MTITPFHEMIHCDGYCSNPLHTASNLQLAHSEFSGMSWGDLDQLWAEEEIAHLTRKQRAALQAQQEAKQAQEAAAAELEALSRKLASKARDHEIKAGYKCNKGKKEMSPCKYLYNPQGDRSTGGAKPTTLHITTECWSHAYTDPATGERIEKHACWFLHPNEPGWCKEWETNRLFRPAEFVAPSNNRFAHLGEPQRQPQQRPQRQQRRQERLQTIQPLQKTTKTPVNKFAALDDSD
jgi:hypothetical protein